MKLIFPTFLILFFSSCTAEKADSPKELMKRIYSLAEAKKYDELKDELYPLISKHYPLRKYMLQYIKEEDKSHIGDLSYSGEAISILIDDHCDGFTSDFTAPFIKDFYEIAPELKNIPKEDWMFLETHKGGIHVIAFKVDGRFKLLFSEGLNKLLNK